MYIIVCTIVNKEKLSRECNQISYRSFSSKISQTKLLNKANSAFLFAPLITIGFVKPIYPYITALDHYEYKWGISTTLKYVHETGALN